MSVPQQMESVSNIQDVKTMAEKLNQSLNQPIYWNKRELFITSSIGISLAPDHGDTPEELMEKADIAMYQSKEKGRNAIQFYDPEEMKSTTDFESNILTFLMSAFPI